MKCQWFRVLLAVTLSLTMGNVAAAGASRAATVEQGISTNAYPNRPVRMLVGFTAGGTVDSLARTIMTQVEAQLGRSIVVDNRGGANGMVAAEIVAHALPDAHTLLFSPPALIINQIITKAPYDTLRDFTPVVNTALGEGSLVVVHPALPVKNIQDLVAFAKTKSLTYGSPGIGNTQHLITEMFNMQAGTTLVHVPYKGIAPAVTAVLSGEVSVLFGPPAIIVQHIKSGRLRAIGFTGEKRWAFMPDVPTISESGVTGFKSTGSFQGIFVPAKTPKEIVSRLHAEISRAIEVPKVRDFVRSAGYEPDGSGPIEFRRLIENDFKRYAQVIRAANIRAE
jgi:tripartite-type tricarboxylate transporter receptor subunit TctC